MSQKLLYLVGIISVIILGTWLNYEFCCQTNTQLNGESTVEKEVSKPVVATKSAIKNGFEFHSEQANFSTTSDFQFEYSKNTLLLPIADSINIGINLLKSSITPTENFEIKGHYANSEQNNSIFPDLGIARATAIKNYLIANGFPAKQIRIKSEEKPELKIQNNILQHAFAYDLVTNSGKAAAVDWKTEKKNLQAKPIILYFDSGENTITLTQENKEKLAAFVNYLDNVPNSVINVIGHTDNNGRKEVNVYYSESRANFVKDYLVQNGISKEKIKIAGKGPKFPIATNETAKGRAKNRRVEITLN